MRENKQELPNENAEEQSEQWRPHRYGWSTGESTPESPQKCPVAQLRLDSTITICITEGRSVRLAYHLTKAKMSIGNMGGGADIQVDDPEVSPLHCAVAITADGVRLYDLDSAHGTFVDDERIDEADLENRSVFRIGSTELVVSIVPNRNLDRM